MVRPTTRSILACLGKKRLIALTAQFELGAPHWERKAAFIEALAEAPQASLEQIMAALPVLELRSICRTHELAVSGKKEALINRLLPPAFAAEPASAPLPSARPEGEAVPDDPAEQLGLDLADVLAKAQPSTGRVFTELRPAERGPILRRLQEHHEIEITAADPSRAAPLLDELCPLPILLAELDRTQLRKVCSRYALRPTGDTRDALIRAILASASGITQQEAHEIEATAAQAQATTAEARAEHRALTTEASVSPPSSDTEHYREAIAALPRGVLQRTEASTSSGALPEPGDIVRARHRQYLVSEVLPSPADETTTSEDNTVVTLVCLDDDAQGRELSVVWELELGVERIDPLAQGLGTIDRFDKPGDFAAYLHALQWNGVTTATNLDDERVQAPFRAGIAVMQHQLVPLQKALALPRANLFIADDVGLGKTIEAGLIMQELLLRQRLDLIIIVCPASICLQWQSEMEQRFGLRFEIVNRDYAARVRRQRGAATKVWNCGRRFIVSYQTLRRPEYQEPLLQVLKGRPPKSLLVLDEAHTVAPASNQQRYAVDSKLTKLARDITPLFENRLFLSATPHNGHSNSFSALLELLDPTRFTRGVPVNGRQQLDAVMVRRLKHDLKGDSTLQFPKRILVELQLRAEQGEWTQVRRERGREDAAEPRSLGARHTDELQLSELLAEYTRLASPTAKRDRQVFIGLQKRLLSSVAAFERTLDVHLRRTGLRILDQMPSGDTDTPQVSTLDEDGEVFAAERDHAVHDAIEGAAPAVAADLKAQATAVIEQMQALARGACRRPEAKILALVDWIRQHQCPAAGANWFQTSPRASKKYSPTRLLIFTEYADTARYIIKMLRAALAGTDREDDRIAYFHGSMSDDGRRELQANFNAKPDQHPVRILVATDAAREGVNLQAHCADLLHYDIPWNPGRLEQRNGRIDRTLQPSPQVRCMYFAYPQRTEDRVLTVVIEKVERIAEQLGSLSAVVLDRIEDALEPHGIDAQSQQRLDLATRGDSVAEQTMRTELDPESSTQALRAQIEQAARCYERSQTFFAPDADGLRQTVERALRMAGSDGGFVPTDDTRDPAFPNEPTHYTIPTLPPDWSRTLDSLRTNKPKDSTWWEWRNTTPPRPVVFKPLSRMTNDVVQLHLEHPLVRRALRRFTAQGYSAHDLRRAALLRYDGMRERVVLIGRLSLFGRGASRLHDSLQHVVANIESAGPPAPVHKAAEFDETLRHMREALRTADTEFHPSEAFTQKRLDRAERDVQALWPLLHTAANDDAEELTRTLDDRGAREAEQLRTILQAQQANIRSALVREPLTATDGADESAAHRQLRLDRAHMQQRLDELEREHNREPDALRTHYAVLTRRIEAVGLLYLVPRSR